MAVAAFPVLLAGRQQGERAGDLSSCGCVCRSGHHNPAPSSEEGWGGGKTCGGGCQSQGFSLFPGISGKCSLPRTCSPASGADEGSGMPSAGKESTLQDPGGQGCFDPGRMGRVVSVQWRQLSHSVSASFCIYRAPTVCQAFSQTLGLQRETKCTCTIQKE